MTAIERDNPTLKDVLPKDYARPALDKTRLGELIDIIGNISLGDKASRSKDILGRVYEYFLGRFAAAEGELGSEFYTAQCVVKLLAEMLEPYEGRVFDPCCGSGGMFVQSEKVVLAHGGGIGDIAIYGQESNVTIWRRVNAPPGGSDSPLPLPSRMSTERTMRELPQTEESQEFAGKDDLHTLVAEFNARGAHRKREGAGTRIRGDGGRRPEHRRSLASHAHQEQSCCV